MSLSILTTDGGWQVGDLIPLVATFTTVATGAVTDPTAVTFKITSPAGITTTYVYGTNGELTQTSTGIYKVLWSITASKRWVGRFEGTGTCQAAIDFAFDVDITTFYL